MAWPRRDKTAAEPKKDAVPPVPKPTSSSNDGYCDTCRKWYSKSEAKEHEHE